MNNITGGFDHEREEREQDGSERTLGGYGRECLAKLSKADIDANLPIGEVQYGAEDYKDCSTRASLNILETKFNFLYNDT